MAIMARRFTYNEAHQITLSKNDAFTRLVFADPTTLRGGTQLTLTHIRREFI